ncbi:histidine phosphatase family protein [Candidatus Woesebacteria bacterium]|nr:MAG: histidine phosphatase family protein [Candidatus Woesebacteria bacterium]
MIFYILRHGETFSSKENDAGYGDKQLTTEILPEAIPAIIRMANYLKVIHPDHAAASEILRVQETVAIATRITGVEFTSDPRLNEMLDERNLEPEYPYSGYFEDKKNMVIDFINEMKTKKYKTVFVATHGIVIAALKHLVTTNSFTVEEVGDYPEPGVLTIINNTTIEEVNFNKL